MYEEGEMSHDGYGLRDLGNGEEGVLDHYGVYLEARYAHGNDDERESYLVGITTRKVYCYCSA